MTQQNLTLDTLRSPQPLDERAANRSRSPQSSTFATFMGSNWAETSQATDNTAVSAVKQFLPARHTAVTRHYPGTVLLVPAGSYKTRSADEDYLFRPHSAFVWLTGLGLEYEPDSAVVFTRTATVIKPSYTSNRRHPAPQTSSMPIPATANSG